MLSLFCRQIKEICLQSLNISKLSLLSNAIVSSVLILTLPILITLKGCISWYPLATGMILNDMIFRDHDIQYISRLPSGNLSGLGGCIFQYIPPLGSVRIQYHSCCQLIPRNTSLQYNNFPEGGDFASLGKSPSPQGMYFSALGSVRNGYNTFRL